MHIFIPWWCVALSPFAAGTIAAMLMPAPGDWDFVTPMMTLGLFLIGLVGTICMFVGHWL